MSLLRAIRFGGAAGSEILISATAFALTVLLVLEGVTVVHMAGLVSAHMFTGVVLIPPVALKLESTGYRAARHYMRSRPYRALGPPRHVCDCSHRRWSRARPRSSSLVSCC